MIIHSDKWFHVTFVVNISYFDLELAKNYTLAIKENYWFQEMNKESDICG